MRSLRIDGRHFGEFRAVVDAGKDFLSQLARLAGVRVGRVGQHDHAQLHFFGDFEIVRVLEVVSLDFVRRNHESFRDVNVVHLLNDEPVAGLLAEPFIRDALRLKRPGQGGAIVEAFADLLLDIILDHPFRDLQSRHVEVVQDQLPLDQCIGGFLEATVRTRF